jgi:hypothetical protein
VKGIAQKPIEGVSMAYSFDDPAAKDRRRTQYFEMLTNRAIYDHGWVAASRFGVRWQTAGREGDFLDSPWELYNLDEDFSAEATSLPSIRISSRSLKRSSMRKPRNTTSIRSTPRTSERFDPKLRESGPPKTNWTYHGNSGGCLNRSDRNSSREVTQSRPN